MIDLLWLIPALPFIGFMMLALTGSRISPRSVAFIGSCSVGLSALVTALVGINFIGALPEAHHYSQTLWTWMSLTGLTSGITFYLDALSLVMILVITVVGFLIHLYSVEFMADEEGYSRFFAYMNLFVGSMLVLVLADNLLLLYLGWEGVGLCSYLLIGFWYKESGNGYAARKAFIVTRVGDTAMAIGIFILSSHLGTLQIQELMQRASAQWPIGSVLAISAAALLLGGAVGKSAQLPLQTWLPDAMAGPTPVSALIHAATMVTAGVYLIARTHVLFTLAPVVQSAVAVIGAATLLLAGFSALTQRDIKRVLAYSTMSQIGYMFLALGVGAWTAAIFHFMTHAFFKALLFLCAGVVIAALDHEHDMFRMGGLRQRLTLTFWCFLIGSASLSAIPFVDAGFYSKETILSQAWASGNGGPLLWGAGIAGAFLTSLYTFRMVFLTFFGEAKGEVTRRPGTIMVVPLVILALFSSLCGFIELPATIADFRLLSDFLDTALPSFTGGRDHGTEVILGIIASFVSLFGVYLAYLSFFRRPPFIAAVEENPFAERIRRFWFSGWGFDRAYRLLFVRPFVWTSRINRDDFIDLFYEGTAWYSRLFHGVLSLSQTGRVRSYATAVALGAAIMIAMAVFL